MSKSTPASNSKGGAAARRAKGEKSAPHASARTFEADTLALQSLRLLAAPDPKDDLTDEQLADYCQKNRFPAEMIQHLIDYVKSI